ncbi:MAG TPA: amidohydrolase family protein [Verrucomicrobiae bacterium]|nr:amidohydrolase family protein [Verrucomicrobiae bacterium]
MMRIDSHQHFWRYEPAQYPWIRADWPLRRDFLPGDLAPLLRAAKLDGCVAVQARQSLEETRWLLGLAAEHNCIKGVVGWVDLRSENLTEQLTAFANHPRFVGVRHVVQDEPHNNFLLRPSFVRGIAELRFFDLAYDLLIFPHQLPAAIQLVREFPRQRFVLDHIAKPYIKRREFWPWAAHIRELAQCPNVFCKLSGMVTEADWNRWKRADFTSYLDVVFEAFTPRRIMYGSDWPVCLLSAGHHQVYDLAATYCQKLSAAEQERVFGGTASKFYRLA